MLIVISIIGLLLAVLVPALFRARTQAKSTVCLTRLRTFGQGFVLYANENRDTMVPGRLPKINDNHWRSKVEGGVKYRPSFLALVSTQTLLRPFEDPQSSRVTKDRFGQPGDRQNYANEAYYCPETADWTDERNGSYGYNYQFLGNARLRDEKLPISFKNWPVKSSAVKTPSGCVVTADCIGTAASFARIERSSYEDNLPGDGRTGRTISALGNEGFNLDPPRVEPHRGELAGSEGGLPVRTAIHERHARRGNTLWMDGHGSGETLRSLGYQVGADGIVGLEGSNRRFSILGTDEAWLER